MQRSGITLLVVAMAEVVGITPESTRFQAQNAPFILDDFAEAVHHAGIRVSAYSLAGLKLSAKEKKKG